MWIFNQPLITINLFIVFKYIIWAFFSTELFSAKHPLYDLVKSFTSQGSSKTGSQLPHSTVEVEQLGWRGPQLLQVQSRGLLGLWFSIPLLLKKRKPKTYRTTLSSKHAVKPASQCSWITAALQAHACKAPKESIFSPSQYHDSQVPFVPSCDRSRNAKRWLTLVTEEDASSKPGSKQIRLMEKEIVYRWPL